MKFNIIGQHNGFSCFLACVESFLADHGTFLSQKQIVRDFPKYCYGTDGKTEGAFHCDIGDLSNLNEMGQRYGFSAKALPNLSIRLTDKQSVLIGFTNFKNEGASHCVRLVGFDKDKTIDRRLIIMNPLKTDAYDRISRKELEDWKPAFILLTAT